MKSERLIYPAFSGVALGSGSNLRVTSMPKNQPSAVGAPAQLLVDIKQAAQILNTTVWQIRELGWAKKLPVVHLGRKWLFRTADLEEFVKRAA